MHRMKASGGRHPIESPDAVLRAVSRDGQVVVRVVRDEAEAFFGAQTKHGHRDVERMTHDRRDQERCQ